MGDLTRIGYDVKDGTTPEYLDPRAAACWFAAVDLIKLRTGYDLSKRILQALGDAKASAGVHRLPGVCVDIRVWGMSDADIEEVVALLRECGFAGTWYRDWEGNQHIHAATDIGVWTPALYQITAVKLGYDGTDTGGRGGPDYHPKPSAWRTAQTGAIWARAQIAQLEDDMPYTEAQLNAIVKKAMTEWAWTDKVQPGNTGVPGTSWRNNTLWTIVYLEQLLGITRELAAKAGVDIDESALTSRITAGVLPALTASLTASIEAKLSGIAGVDASALAREVVAELGAALAPTV